MKSSYPDISEILSAKAGHRQALAALPWEEKVTIIEKMQQLPPRGMWKDRVSDKKRQDTDQDALQRYKGRQAPSCGFENCCFVLRQLTGMPCGRLARPLTCLSLNL